MTESSMSTSADGWRAVGVGGFTIALCITPSRPFYSIVYSDYTALLMATCLVFRGPQLAQVHAVRSGYKLGSPKDSTNCALDGV